MPFFNAQQLRFVFLGKKATSNYSHPHLFILIPALKAAETDCHCSAKVTQIAFIYGEAGKYLYLSHLLLIPANPRQHSGSQGLWQNASQYISTVHSDGEKKTERKKENIDAVPVRSYDVFPAADAAQPQPVNMLPSCVCSSENTRAASIHPSPPSLCFPSLLSLRQPSPEDGSSLGGGPLAHVATGRVPTPPRAPC